jgi:class 3 adenylate cyclase/tetratricopeptide (TPR) repeat protein
VGGGTDHGSVHVANVHFYVVVRGSSGEGGAMGTCSACAADLPDGARFCPSCGASTSGRPAPTTHAERRPVTVLFADAVGSTAFTERAGDEAAYRFVQRCVATMSAAIERHGGTITQFRGDGVMALFGAPVAHERAAVDAVTAALEIQEALRDVEGECAFRVGLSTGPVVVGRVGDDVLMDYTAIGDTANVAARMESAAEPGSVLLSESTWRVVREYVECRRVGELPLKGKSEPVVAHEAIRRRAIQTRLDAAVERGLGPFVGRAAELDLLWSHAAALAEGRGHVVEIVGDAGIGKSRLLLELRRMLPEHATWHQGQCAPSAVDTPHLPITDLLRDAFGIRATDDPDTIAARIDAAIQQWSPNAADTVPYLKYVLDIDPGDQSVQSEDARIRRAAVLEAFRASFADAARRRPRVVVLEDVHWADPASLDALTVLADVAAREPMLLITTSRPGGASPFSTASPHIRLALDRVSTDDGAMLAAAALSVERVPDHIAALIDERAEGNPLYVEELAATLVETGLVVRRDDELRLARAAEAIDIPGSLHELILARIDRLPREARDALQLAAVIGREFTVRLLDRLADLPAGLDDALEELRSVELIRQKSLYPELAYLFKHALTHDVTYATLLDERRRDLHRLAAMAIEDVYADRLAEHVPALAHHWSVAEDAPRAARYFALAGDAAAAIFSNASAVTFYEQAITAHLQSGDRAGAMSVALRLGDVHMAVGDLAAASVAFEQAADHARAVGDDEHLAWALAYRGESLSYMHELDRGEVLLLATLAVERATPAPKIYAATWLAAARAIHGRHDEVAEVDTELATLVAAAPVDHPRAITAIQTLDALRGRWRGELDEARALLLEPVPDASDLLIVQSLRWELGMVEGETGHYDDALATLGETVAHSERGGEVMFRARSLNTIGWIRGELGDHVGGIEWNQRCLQFLRDAGFPDEEIESNARLNLAEIHLRSGTLGAAGEELTAVEELNRGRPVRGSWMVWRFRQRMLLLATELALARGAPAPARHLEEAGVLAEESSSAKYLGKVARVAAAVALAGRDLELAASQATEALATATSIGHPPERWRSLALLADIATAAGDADLAHEHRHAADAVLASLDVGDPGCRAGIASLRAALARA